MAIVAIPGVSVSVRIWPGLSGINVPLLPSPVSVAVGIVSSVVPIAMSISIMAKAIAMAIVAIPGVSVSVRIWPGLSGINVPLLPSPVSVGIRIVSAVVSIAMS